jgi:hypothetical protein
MDVPINPYESPRQPLPAATVAIARPGRPAAWAIKSIVFYFCAFLFHATMTCGCHFWWSALVIEATPIAWSGFTFFTYRTTGERLIAWLNVALVLLWLWFSWMNNLQFFP